MDKSVWSNLDNSTEVSDALAFSSTAELPTSTLFSGRHRLSSAILATVGLIVCSVGAFANAVVLTVLIRARRHSGSAVHTLIANQSAMDLFACVFSIICFVVMLTHGFKYNGNNKILDGTICVLFEGVALAGVGISAEKFGLVVITLERYFKIVHAIAHRKYYSNWMTKVGVALPWIGGMGLTLFPQMGTTRIVNGQCMRLRFWPNGAMALVSLHLFLQNPA